MPTHNTGGSTATWRPDIAGTLEKFDVEANEAGFVGLQIAPVVEADEQAGFYTVIPEKDLLQNVQDDRRNNDGTYKRVEGEGETRNYATGEHGIEERIDDRRSTIQRHFWNATMIATRRTREIVQRNLNKRIIDKSLAIGNNANASAVWTNPATNIIDDVRQAQIRVRNRCGMIPDTLVIDWEVWSYFSDNDKLLDKFVGAANRSADALDLSLMAGALNVRRIIVSGAVNNGAPMPEAASFSSMWPKSKALLFKSSSDPDMMKPRFMNTIHWGEDGSQIGGTIETYYSDDRRSDIVRHRNDVTEHVVYSACAEVLNQVA